MALLKGMLQNGCYRFYIERKYSDITLITADKIRFQCHKLVLAVVSEVFEKQFFIDNLDVREIELKNINAEAFTLFINCVYQDDELNIDSNDVAIEIYKFCYEFKVNNLFMELQNYFVKNPPVTLLKCINALNDFGSEDVLEHCENILNGDLKEVLECDEFLNCSLQTVTKFTTYKYVNVSELELFKAIDKWVDHITECKGADSDNLKMFFDEILKNIRFLTMTSKQFISGPMISNLITSDDKLSLLSNINVPDSVPIPEKFTNIRLKRELTFFKDIEILAYEDEPWTKIKWYTMNISKFNFKNKKEYRTEKFRLKKTENEFIVIANLYTNDTNDRCISVSIQSCNNNNIKIKSCKFGFGIMGEIYIRDKRTLENFDIGQNEVKKFEELSIQEIEEEEYYNEDCLKLYVYFLF